MSPTVEPYVLYEINAAFRGAKREFESGKVKNGGSICYAKGGVL